MAYIYCKALKYNEVYLLSVLSVRYFRHTKFKSINNIEQLPNMEKLAPPEGEGVGVGQNFIFF